MIKLEDLRGLHYSAQFTMTCDDCGKQFSRKVATLTKVFRRKNAHTITRYCSASCRYRNEPWKTPRANKSPEPQTFKAVCKHCSKTFNAARRTQGKYCSKACTSRATAFDRSKILKRLVKKNPEKYFHPINRSKAEMLLEERLKKIFPQLKIIGNDIKTLPGRQIDISFPELQLAIEWNGPPHYIPIWGLESLESTQSRDRTKRQSIFNLGWSLVVLKSPAHLRTPNDRVLRVLPRLIEHINMILTDTTEMPVPYYQHWEFEQNQKRV